MTPQEFKDWHGIWEYFADHDDYWADRILEIIKDRASPEPVDREAIAEIWAGAAIWMAFWLAFAAVVCMTLWKVL